MKLPLDIPRAIHDAAEVVLSAVDGADRTDVASLDPVLSGLDELQSIIQEQPIPTQHHPEVRAKLDRVMGAVGTLVKDLQEAKDDVGRTLARLRSKKRPAHSTPTRIDIQY